MKKLSFTLTVLICFIFQSVAQNPGVIDSTFNPGTGANDAVYYLEKYPGNRIVTCGMYTSYNGVTHNRITMLTPFGVTDPTFQIGTGANGPIWVLNVEPDGKILIAGDFTSYNGVSANRIARINPNGSLDQTFNAGSGANSWVYMILRQNDGKILLGGTFTNFNNSGKNYLVRLNSNGSVDTTFSHKINSKVSNGAIDAEGKIIVGGSFTQHGLNSANYICRIKPNGDFDSTFVIGSGASHEVRSFAIQNDGKIVIGGYFVSYKNQPAWRITRLKPNGSLDSSFVPSNTNLGPVYRVEVLKSGKILVMGNFTNYGGSNRSYFLQLKSNGSIDSSFNSGTGTNNAAQTSHELDNGKIAIGGFFTNYNLNPRSRIAIVQGDQLYVTDTNTVNIIRGKIFVNVDNNCEQSSAEQIQQYKIVKAEPGPYWGNTFSTGKYEIKVDTGTYQIQQVKSSLEQLLETQFCPPNSAPYNVQFSQLGDTISNLDFSNTVQSCPILKIEVSSNRRRRCFRNHTYVTVSNSGTSPSYNVKAYLKLPHLVNLISASESFSFLTPDSVYVFSIDSVIPNQIKIIHIIDSVSCVPGVMGIEQCTKVWATPKNTCVLSNSGWDGVDLVTTGQCSNFVPYFKIKNNGASMTSSRNYLVFADSLLVETNSFTLNAGDSLMLAIAGANPNAVVRIEVPQSNNHPFSSFASATAPCSLIPRPTGFFAESDEDPIVSTHCLPILDSYDPNDKLVYPRGSTANGNVSPGKYFHYTIRFQNTGNDTAYKVVVIDSLDAGLDPSSFELISSSHPYTFSISGKGNPVLKWKFNNIMLPDSHVNAAASNGFVSFRIRPFATAALGTRIENNADIYFDFNDPIRTNTTVNTLFIPTVTPNVIDSVQVVTETKKQMASNALIQIYPNPTKGKISVKSPFTNIEFRLLTITGKELISKRKAGNDIDFQFLPKGIYQIEFTTPAGKSVKKLILE